MANFVEEPDYELHPACTTPAVSDPPRDLGATGTPFGTKHLIELNFTTAHQRANGEYFQIKKRVTKSLARKATLRSIAAALLGEPLPKRIDLDSLADRDCVLVITHNVDRTGRTWANVSQVLPAGAKPPAPAPSITPGPLYARMIELEKARPQSFTLPAEVHK